MIKLINKPEHVELVKAIGSKDVAVSRQAQEAFAAAIGVVISEVIRQAGTVSLIYEDQPFNEDESPSFPLDLYYNEEVNYVTTWSQEMAGGLPSSQVEGVAEMKISTYRLDSAVHFLKKYARKHNLNVLSKAISKTTQEILVKQERMGWAVILRALAEANSDGTTHIITSTTQNTFQVDDLSRLITRTKRVNKSFADGTPENPYSRGITDLFVSPEIKEQVRGFAYNPQNTTAVPNTDESTAVPLPDSIREQIFRSAGMDEIYGITITDLIELGTTQKYNVLFGNYASAGIAHSAANFNTSTDEILVGVDLTKGAFIRAVETDADSNAQFTLIPDDQWVSRSEKIGFYGWVNEGRVCINGKSVMGIIV